MITAATCDKDISSVSIILQNEDVY